MKTKVKTIWGAGFVSVADKYIKKALDLKEGLEIEYNGKTMSIPYEKLLEKKPRGSTFIDKFGRKKEYTLYDFFWENTK